jgi:hypothetical protein
VERDLLHGLPLSTADAAVWPGLRRVKHCAAMASPRHVSIVAGTPD